MSGHIIIGLTLIAAVGIGFLVHEFIKAPLIDDPGELDTIALYLSDTPLYLEAARCTPGAMEAMVSARRAQYLRLLTSEGDR